jgi:hypothetical protein
MKTALQVRSEYVSIEDRLRLSCEVGEGEVVNLWLTMRLTHRLAARLLAWLEAQMQADGSLRGDVAQGMAQLSAQKDPAGKPKSQVHPDKALDGWLVTKIDVVTGKKAVSMTFRTESPYTPQIQLAFEAVPLRKWLALLCRQCEAAEWPMAVWPEWLQLASKGKLPPGWSGLGQVMQVFK